MGSRSRRSLVTSIFLVLFALLTAVTPSLAASYWPATKVNARLNDSAFLLGPDGRAHVITGGYGSVRYFRERTDGTFAVQTIAAHGGLLPTASFDPDTGRLVVMYARLGCADCTPEDFVGLYMSRQTATGWTTPTAFTTNREDGHPVLRIRRNGSQTKWYVTWARGGAGVMFRSRVVGSAWSASAKLISEPRFDTLFFGPDIQMRIDPAGKAHIAYVSPLEDDTDASDGIRYLTNASGSWQARMIRPGLDFRDPSIAIDGSGILHMAYAGAHRTSTGALRPGTYYSRHDTTAAITSWSAPRFVSTASDDVSLTLDGATPVVALTDFADGIWTKRRNSDGSWPAATHVKPANNDGADIRVTPSTAPAAVGARKSRILYRNWGETTSGTYMARQP